MLTDQSRLQLSLKTLQDFFASEAFLWVPSEISQPVSEAFQHVKSSIIDIYAIPKGFSNELKNSIKTRYKQTQVARVSKPAVPSAALKSFATSKILRRLHRVVDMHQPLDLYLIFRTAETRWFNLFARVYSRWAACIYWKKDPYLMFTSKTTTLAEEPGQINTLFKTKRRNVVVKPQSPTQKPRISLLLSAQMTALNDKKSIRRSAYYVMMKYINRFLLASFSQWKTVTAVHSFISPWLRTQHIITTAGDNYIASYYAIKHAVCCFRRMSRATLLRVLFKWKIKMPRLPNYQAREPRKTFFEQEEDSIKVIESVKKKLEEDRAEIFSRRNRD